MGRVDSRNSSKYRLHERMDDVLMDVASHFPSTIFHTSSCTEYASEIQSRCIHVRLVVLYLRSQGRHIWCPHFRHGNRVMNTDRYTNTELADFHYIYGLANGNGRVAVRLYEERYPTKLQANHQTFTWVHQNLVEHETFRARIDDMPVNFEMDLVARISIAAATIRETPCIFEHVHQSISRQCLACINVYGNNFKHLL
ncbi:hypothetical protein TNCV_3960841 [Trichonephila clavipes]|nr:hypothetical protein TNCV_3960841 [Trichonephila clavipes]